MNLEEFYNKIGGDYQGVINRLTNEDRIVRFIFKFKEKSIIEQLEYALKDENWTEAFRAAHNLKGVCQNLGFTELANSSSELCETMRHGKPSIDITALTDRVRNDYSLTIQSIDDVLL